MVKQIIIERYKQPDFTYERICQIFEDKRREIYNEGLSPTMVVDGVYVMIRRMEPIIDEKGKTIGVKKIPAELIVYKYIKE